MHEDAPTFAHIQKNILQSRKEPIKILIATPLGRWSLKVPSPALLSSEPCPELSSTALTLLSPPWLCPSCQRQPHWHSPSHCEDLRVIPGDGEDSVGWCSGDMGIAHWWLRAWLSWWGQLVGVGQKASSLGFTLSPFNQFHCYPLLYAAM